MSTPEVTHDNNFQIFICNGKLNAAVDILTSAQSNNLQQTVHNPIIVVMQNANDMLEILKSEVRLNVIDIMTNRAEQRVGNALKIKYPLYK